MSSFTVTIARSAVQVVELVVEGVESQHEAETLVGNALDSPRRIGVDDLLASVATGILSSEYYPDDESSWEVQ